MSGNTRKNVYCTGSKTKWISVINRIKIVSFLFLLYNSYAIAGDSKLFSFTQVHVRYILKNEMH